MEDFILENFADKDKIDEIITEAYFIKGAEKIKPLEDAFQKLKDSYENIIEGRDDVKVKITKDEFSKFIKSDDFKMLESAIIEIFGVRSVNIYPMIIRNGKHDEILNAYTFTGLQTRYVIDGLITEEGFYDKTHTLVTEINISAGAFEKCTARELVALFLHEFGHNIDPKLVDIKYTGIDEIVNSITGKKMVNSSNGKHGFSDLGILVGYFGGIAIYIIMLALGSFVKYIIDYFRPEEKRLERLKKSLKYTKLIMDKNKNIEAFADNLTRMYGYGKDLISALNIIGDEYDKVTLRGSERNRQRIIENMIRNSVSDIHGTDIQRARALIKEYEDDLKDPNIPKKIKDNIQKDLDGLKEMYEMYTKTPDEFKNKMNAMIKDQLELEYAKQEKKEEKENNK